MKRSILACLVIAGFFMAMPPARAHENLETAGSYEFIVCKGACTWSDRGNVFATVTVVLFDHALAKLDLARIAPLNHREPRTLRACYAIDRKKPAASYIGISNRSGASPWTLDGAVIEFELFHSPDAGYVVHVSREGNLLTGTGQSWGAGMGAPPDDYGLDTIVGRRLGPPDRARCVSAPPL